MLCGRAQVRPPPAVAHATRRERERIHTGIKLMDSFHTTAKGDRVTLTGNKRTGKSSVALDIMVNQGRRGMRCVYVAMGHSEARITHIRKYLDDAGVLDVSTIVAANIYDPFALQV